MIDPGLLERHNLTTGEYALIVDLIGREPNLVELGIFSVMWSEHCGYKSSKAHLKKLPVRGPRVIQGPGENAGVLDIGDGLAVVFKIESHNHPSFIEPYQGAATGVGGILRDIFTMGARPVAVMDSLRFGPLDNPANRSIMEGVVSGIAGYGNAFGVPTVGGETAFNPCYTFNPLVNVFCLGLAEKDKIFYAKAGRPGNAVLYVGARTGRDGIHGATMASAEFGKDTEQKRPNVQVGDPFKEKLLLEACLEVMDRNLIVGIQDMGAAGLTCSTTEVAAKSGLGIRIDLDRVPQREESMTPYEIMLSESQERMLIVAEEDKVPAVQAVFAKWDLEAPVIGRVEEGGRLSVRFKGKDIIDIPVDAVVNLCPVYHRPIQPPPPEKRKDLRKIPRRPPLHDCAEALMTLLSSPALADKTWIFRQYDHMVQTNTALPPGADAAVLRIKGTRRGLAMTVDGNSLHVLLDPKTGGRAAVAEACRNLACVGARPIGVTNCLNFGNPEKPEIMWQFEQAVKGMAEACRAFGIPVTGGNVSFYNDTEGASIHPTPVLGVVGLIDDIDKIVRPGFVNTGDIVIQLGGNGNEPGGSAFLQILHGLERGRPPRMDLIKEKAVQDLCLEAAEAGWLRSAHDVSEGGLAVCLAECCLLGPRGRGCDVRLEDPFPTDVLLFGETQSRIVVTVREKDLGKLKAAVRRARVPATVLGRVGGSALVIRRRGSELIRLRVEDIRRRWERAIPDLFRIS